MSELRGIARSLVAEAKGILAADEGGETIVARFEKLGIIPTTESRRAFREMLFTTPGVEEFISGVILFDDTIRESSSEGVRFSALLSE